MRTFKTIDEWMNTNPPAEEKKKVIALINKGAVSHTRKEIYELQKYLRKLQAGENIMKKLGLPFTEDGLKRIKDVKNQIAELSKGLPVSEKRAKREVVEN